MDHNDEKLLNTKLLGARIKEAREHIIDDNGKKLSQEALADMLDLTATYIRHVEGGQRTPRLQYFIDFCRALNTTPNFFKDYLYNEYNDIIDEIIK